MRLFYFYVMQKSLYFLIALSLALFACNDTAPQNEASQQEQLSPLDSLNDAIVASPLKARLYLERGTIYLEEGKPGKALLDFDQAIEIDPNFDLAIFKKGELLYANTQYKEAMLEYQRCLEVNPENVDCLLKSAEMNIHLQQYGKAVDDINTALRIDDQLPFAYYMKGRIYKETGDSSLAVSSYQTAVEVDPSYYEAYIEAGLLYAAAGSDLALEYFNTAMDLKPRSVEAKYATAYYLQESFAKDTARVSDAKELYQEILEIDPNNAAAAFNQGFIELEYRMNYRKALEHFSLAVDLFPQYYQAYYNRGLCHESLDERNLALADYDKALSIEPTYTPAALGKGRILDGE